MITLLLVMDPFGNIPDFLSVLSEVNPGRHRRIILREMGIAFVTLVIFLFFGRYILTGLHLSQYALSISGGVVLFIIALRMIFPSLKDQSAEEYAQEPMIVPLAIPMVAGPSSMAIVILFATQYPDRLHVWFGALAVAWLISTVVLVFSDQLGRIAGKRGLSAIERLMGLILTVMAVQMLLTGAREFAKTF